MNPPNELVILFKEFWDSMVGKTMIVFFLALLGIMTVHILHLKKDNPIEEVLEIEIEQIIGIKPDLTPGE